MKYLQLIILSVLLLIGQPTFASRTDPGAFQFPGASIEINIANAPAWTTGTTHQLKDRIVAGAGWNGSAYTSGQPLCLFGLTVAGASGSDATVFNTACASGTPAAVGGGLDGTIPSGWSSATSVTDGGATWKLLTRVDYVSFTGFNCDDSRTWTTSTTYHHIDHVVNSSGNCYRNDVTFAGADPCTSSTEPTGTTFNTSITDNNCRWFYMGPVTYSSQANRLPHQIKQASGYTEQFASNATVRLWYGGADQPRYGPEEPHEIAPFQMRYHAEQVADASVFCKDATSTFFWSCVGTGSGYTITLTAATGDSLGENITAIDGPLRYDETKGVAIYSAATPAALGVGQAFNLGDSKVKLVGLQIWSESAEALPTTPGNSAWTFGPSNTNFIELYRSFVYGGGGPSAFSCDYGCVIGNSVIVSNSSTSGMTPLHFKYQGMVYYTDLICKPGVTNSTGLQQVHYLATSTTPHTMPFYDNTILGCSKPFAYGDLTYGTDVSGDKNAIDLATGASGSFTDPTFGTGTLTVADFPGTTLSSLTASNQLTNPTPGVSFDARVKNTSADIYGTGATFSFTQSGGETSLAYLSPITPGSDFFSTIRPVSGRYDIGAAMFATTGSCTLDSVSLSGSHHFPGGSTAGTVVGTMSAGTTGSCSSVSWSIVSSGADHASTTCNVASGTDFQAVGSSLELNTTLSAGSYTAICYKATISGATPGTFTQAVDITGDAVTGAVKGKRRVGRVW